MLWALGVNCLSCSDNRRGFYSQGHIKFPNFKCLTTDTHVWLPLVSSFDLSSLEVQGDQDLSASSNTTP